ncbi:hypothetical protein IQ06DRAFT_351245 [Phaeosphaeriaceae sp. SRC1lsM3a]|nr:hypothetical protein IQ06DRAFT_351245 [Stagonospora sp. SRC1lsM3a]
MARKSAKKDGKIKAREEVDAAQPWDLDNDLLVRGRAPGDEADGEEEVDLGLVGTGDEFERHYDEQDQAVEAARRRGNGADDPLEGQNDAAVRGQADDTSHKQENDAGQDESNDPTESEKSTSSELDVMAELSDNWGINKLTEVISKENWFKGSKYTKNPKAKIKQNYEDDPNEWDRETQDAILGLSLLTKNDPARAKELIQKYWNERDKSHFRDKERLNIGQGWVEKEPRLREDLKLIIKDLEAHANGRSGSSGRGSDCAAPGTEDAEQPDGPANGTRAKTNKGKGKARKVLEKVPEDTDEPAGETAWDNGKGKKKKKKKSSHAANPLVAEPVAPRRTAAEQEKRAKKPGAGTTKNLKGKAPLSSATLEAGRSPGTGHSLQTGHPIQAQLSMQAPSLAQARFSQPPCLLQQPPLAQDIPATAQGLQFAQNNLMDAQLQRGLAEAREQTAKANRSIRALAASPLEVAAAEADVALAREDVAKFNVTVVMWARKVAEIEEQRSAGQ